MRARCARALSMRCPFCRHKNNRVTDTRMSADGRNIRRRRMCTSCKRRFTTYEHLEEALPMVVKKDNRREPFERQKIIAGLRRACEKRPVPTETVEDVADRVERAVLDLGAKEVSSSVIGNFVMNELHKIDQIAYVRFASVYRSFKDIDEFMRELQDLIRKRQEPAHHEGRSRDRKSD